MIDSWKRMYALGGCPCFENKARDERIIVTYRNKWEVDVNSKRIGSSSTEAGAKEIVIKYIDSHP